MHCRLQTGLWKLKLVKSSFITNLWSNDALNTYTSRPFEQRKGVVYDQNQIVSKVHLKLCCKIFGKLFIAVYQFFQLWNKVQIHIIFNISKHRSIYMRISPNPIFVSLFLPRLFYWQYYRPFSSRYKLQINPLSNKCFP